MSSRGTKEILEARKISSSERTELTAEAKEMKAQGTSVMDDDENLVESGSSSEISLDGLHANKSVTELHHGQPTSPCLEDMMG